MALQRKKKYDRTTDEILSKYGVSQTTGREHTKPEDDDIAPVKTTTTEAPVIHSSGDSETDKLLYKYGISQTIGSADNIAKWNSDSVNLLNEMSKFYDGSYRTKEELTSFRDSTMAQMYQLLADSSKYREKYKDNAEVSKRIDEIYQALNGANRTATGIASTMPKYSEEEYNKVMLDYNMRQKYRGMSGDELNIAHSILKDGAEKDWLNEYIANPLNYMTLDELKAKKDDNSLSRKDRVYYRSLYNQKLILENADVLSKEQMDGLGHSVLEEMKLLSEMEDSDEKKKRKEAVLKKMEELGLATEDYALYYGDDHFSWDNLWNFVTTNIGAGLSGVSAGLTNTLDTILGTPLKWLGWENNPLSLLNNQVQGELADASALAAFATDRFGGGTGVEFASGALQGVGNSIPSAIMALMTAGASLGAQGASTAASASSLATQSAYRAGNILTKAGLTAETMMKNPQMWLSFAQTYGDSYDKAIEMGADDVVAALGATFTSLVNAGLEVGIDGTSGIQGLPESVAQDGNQLLKWAISSAEEGGEEVMQGFVDRAVAKLLYGSDEKVLDPEEMLMEFGTGAVAGGAVGGGQIVVQSGVNATAGAINQYQASKLNATEKQVFDAIVSERIEAREADGTKLTASQKKQISNEVRQALERGDISTEDIERILGGEAYETYKGTVDSEEAIIKEYNELKSRLDSLTPAELARLAELTPQFKDIEGSSPRAEQAGILRDKVLGLINGSRLTESYNQRALRGQAFQADVSKYDPEMQATIQEAIDSGILNNTRKTHDMVEFGAGISKLTGLKIHYVDNAMMEKMGHGAKDGIVKNGFIQDGEIYLNVQGGKVLESLIGHEVTHALEKTAFYSELQKLLFEYADMKGEYHDRLDTIRELYRKGDPNADVFKELTADLVGDYLFKDTDFINHLSSKNRNIFQKIYDDIKYLIKLATAGSDEERKLLQVKKAFEECLHNDRKPKHKGVTKYQDSGRDIDAEGTKHSLGYHAGDLGKAESYIQQSGSRSTGHFGTGTYFVGNEAKISDGTYGKRPHESVEFDNYHLYKVSGDKDGYALHDQLKVIDGGFTQEFLDAAISRDFNVSNMRGEAWELADRYDDGDFIGSAVRAFTEVAQNNGIEIQSYDEWLAEQSDDVPKQGDSDYDFYKGDYLDYLKDTLAEADNEKNDGYEGFSDAYFKLWLRFGNNVNGALQAVIEHDAAMEQGGYEVQKTADSRATVFMKALGYEGIDVSGTALDNTTYGSVIYDLKGTDAKRKADIGTATYSLSDSEITEEQNNQGLAREQEVQYSISRDGEFSDNAIALNNTTKNVDPVVLNAARAVRDEVAKRLTAMQAKGVALPPDTEGDTWFEDKSYGGTMENTLVCPRSLAPEAFMDAVSENIGRPLTVKEQIYVGQELMTLMTTSEELRSNSFMAQCVYCYVAADRMAQREFLGKYIEQRDAVLAKISPDMDISTLEADHNALSQWWANKKGMKKPELSEIGKLYQEYLAKRKPTGATYERFKMWVEAYINGSPMIDGNHLASIEKLTGDLSKFGAELIPQIEDAWKYAQSASWAKKRTSYMAYNGQILEWDADVINALNEHYGMRMYSFSDYHPAFVLENMQMITDAAVRGLKVLAYTKDLDFVEIFAPSHANINISVFGFEKDGNIYEDNRMGADWARAQALRQKYDNVGCTFVATSDTMVEWALQQDWIDVVIPYHMVKTGQVIADHYGYTNYTRESSDKKVRSKWKDKAWAEGKQSSISPVQHGNDLDTYFAQLADNGLTARFKRFYDNPKTRPYYMKLVNECRLSASEVQPVQPNFDQEAIARTLARLETEGYYTPIGGSVERMYEIAAEVAENMIAPTGNTQFSLGTDSKADSQYALIVESGDMEMAQRMVDHMAFINGYIPVTRYHQTASRFTRFSTDNPVAALHDSETPNGIFLKTNDHDIGIGGNIQMKLYIKAENMLHFADRKEANAWYCKNVPGYDALQKEMGKALQPFQDQIDAITEQEWDENKSDEEIDALFEEERRVIKEMGKVEDSYCLKLRELLDQYFLRGESGYDGIELDYDGHRWVNGKREDVHTFIVFDPSQVKSADPVTYDDNGNVIPPSQRFNPAEQDMRYSLSWEGETPAPGGRFYGEDVYLDPSAQEQMQDAVPTQEDIDEAIAPVESFPVGDENIAPTEDFERQRIESLDDADAPPEKDAPFYSPDTNPLPDKALRNISRKVRSAFIFLKNNQMAEVRELIQRYSTGEIGREQLRQEFQDRFGEYEDSMPDDVLAEAKQFMRTNPIFVSDAIKHGIPDYALWMRSNFGKLRFSKNGLDVDSAYQELSDLYPHLFPADIITPEDQLLQMSEVANKSIDYGYGVVQVDDADIDAAVDAIINGVGEFKTEDSRKFADREYREYMKHFMESADDYAPTPDFEQTFKPEQIPPRPSSPIEDAPIFTEIDGDREGVLEGQQAMWDDAKEEFEAIRPQPKSKTGNRLHRVGSAEQQKIAAVLDAEPGTVKKNSRAWARFVANVIDKGAVFETLGLKTGNRELQGKWNFILSSEARAQQLIGNGADGVKSLTSIIEGIGKTGKTQQFSEYLYHVHNIDRMTLAERYDDVPNKAVFGDSVTADVSRTYVAQAEAENPEFKQLAEEVYTYNRHLRQLLVDNGVISQEVADLWEEMYPHYVPIRRVGHTGLNINVPLDTGRTGVNAPVKKATGGDQDILPLFDTMAQRTIQTYRAIARNSFGVELKNTLGTTIANGKTGVDEAIESIDSQEGLLQKGQNGNRPTFTVFEDGKKVTFEITEDMYDALKPVSEGLAYTNKVANTAGNIFRGVLTEYNPVFMLTNGIKDVQDILINSQHPLQTYAKLGEAYAQMVKKGYWYQEYIQNGGERNSYFDNETSSFIPQKKNPLRIPFEAISKVNNFVEMSPRLAEYIASREAGASIEVAMLDAARVTTNFAAGGDLGKFLNRNGATFLNASIQGAMQQVRNVREANANGLRGWAALAAKAVIAGLPALLLNGLLWDDDEEYEELSDYVKQNYYVIAKYGDGQFVRIPKGRTVAVIQNAFEQVANAVTGNDDVDLKSFIDLVVTNLAPNNPVENNILSPIIQVINNETWYGEDLVPTRLQDLPAAEQYDESTDAISRWLGEKLNISPIKINYLLNQYTGGVGDVFLPMLTPEAERGDDSLLGNLISPLKDKFTTDGVMNNQNVSDFYDTMDELTMNAKSSKATDEDVLKYKYFNAMNSELSDLYRKKREIQNSDLSDAEKYAQVREIQQQIVDITKESLNSYGNVSIEGNYATVGDQQFRWHEPGEDSDAEPGWQKLTADQIEKQDKVTKGLGISQSEYWGNKGEYDFAYEYPDKYKFLNNNGVSYSDYANGSEEFKDAWTWASKNPEKFTFSKAVADDVVTYRKYASDLYDIKADKDSSGKSIVGSRKAKVFDYINNMDADYGAKIILWKSEYPSDDTYNYEIVDYLNSRDDISYDEMVTILKELGFTVKGNNITWD